MHPVLLSILFGIAAGLADRLRETCDFTSWTAAWLKFWKINNIHWHYWWKSIDKFELQGWYNYIWRDGYHLFKTLTFALLLLFPAVAIWQGFSILESLHMPLWFGLTQYYYNIWIKHISES